MTGATASWEESAHGYPVPESRRAKSGYSPPKDPRQTSLADALAGTSRLPESKQLDLLASSPDEPSFDNLRLYVAGDLSLLKRPCVAIVGTRNVSKAGAMRTRRLARELASAGIVIVSGLAEGVDTHAHTAAIEAGGSTIAVIGTPLDKAYPAENAKLQEAIYRDHLLISRIASGERTFKSSFPQRNRLMARLTDATVVMEASDTSGTLHQAVECTRLERWLFIARSVVDDQTLKWPKRFLTPSNPMCIPLDTIADITSRILR